MAFWTVGVFLTFDRMEQKRCSASNPLTSKLHNPLTLTFWSTLIKPSEPPSSSTDFTIWSNSSSAFSSLARIWINTFLFWSGMDWESYFTEEQRQQRLLRWFQPSPWYQPSGRLRHEAEPDKLDCRGDGCQAQHVLPAVRLNVGEGTADACGDELAKSDDEHVAAHKQSPGLSWGSLRNVDGHAHGGEPDANAHNQPVERDKPMFEYWTYKFKKKTCFAEGMRLRDFPLKLFVIIQSFLEPRPRTSRAQT